MEDYEDAYSRAAETDPHLKGLSFDDFTQALFAKGIFYGDAWVNALQAAGCPARETVPVCLPLQYRWAQENNVPLPPSFVSDAPFRWYWQLRYGNTPTRHALWRIVEAQLQHWQPQFTWIFSGVPVALDQLHRWRKHTEQLLLWWTSAPEPGFPYNGFDLILTAEPVRATTFRDQGLNAALLPHAFDPQVLTQVQPPADRIPGVAFVGNVSREHHERRRFLETLAGAVALDIYGNGFECLPPDNPLRACVHASAWGKDLYRIYGSHLIAFHKQADTLGSTAASKRIFEATGMGACLVTELTSDLKNFFEPDREVVTYRSVEECVEKMQWLLAHPAEAAAIGQRGQARALRDHTYRQRVDRLLEILNDK